MGELVFIGAGLGDDQDLSRRSVAILRECDRVFAEEYTAVLAPGSLDRLSKEIGRPIVLLDRAQVEGEKTVLDALEGGHRVALLVPGDPFAATTHVALRLAAEARGHTWRYRPGASILTAAAGFLGLQPYRFGRVVSLPFPEPGFAPTSPLEQIARNRAADAHTLVLLDLRPVEGRFLTADRAIAVLDARDPLAAYIPRDVAIAVAARVGRDTPEAWYGTRADLAQVDFGPPMHVLVVPAATLHFEEHAALERVRWPRPT
jgi:diphthine synthase